MDTASAVCRSPASGNLQDGGSPGHHGLLECGQMQTEPCRCTRAATCNSTGVGQSAKDTIDQWGGMLPVGYVDISALARSLHHVDGKQVTDSSAEECHAEIEMAPSWALPATCDGQQATNPHLGKWSDPKRWTTRPRG